MTDEELAKAAYPQGVSSADRMSLSDLNGAVLTYEDGDGNEVRVPFSEE